jgi:hypothetical protein
MWKACLTNFFSYVNLIKFFCGPYSRDYFVVVATSTSRNVLRQRDGEVVGVCGYDVWQSRADDS